MSRRNPHDLHKPEAMRTVTIAGKRWRVDASLKPSNWNVTLSRLLRSLKKNPLP